MRVSRPSGGSLAVAGRVRRDEERVNDGGAEVLAGRVVEGAAARYQAQSREAGRVPVHGFRRELGFQVLTYAGDAENSGDPVGEPHVDEVSRAQRPQPVEDGRALFAVDVTLNDRRPNLAGGH